MLIMLICSIDVISQKKFKMIAKQNNFKDVIFV